MTEFDVEYLYTTIEYNVGPEYPEWLCITPQLELVQTTIDVEINAGSIDE